MAKETTHSLRDKQLLKLAANGASGQEMFEKTGMPAAQAILRVKEMLSAGRNAYDEMEQRELTLLSLKRMKAEIEDAGIDVENPKHIESYTKVNLAIDRISLNKDRISDEDLQKVTEAQARKLLQLVEAAYGYARTKLKDEYGDFIDMEVLDSAFHDGLRKASQEIGA